MWVYTGYFGLLGSHIIDSLGSAQCSIILRQWTNHIACNTKITQWVHYYNNNYNYLERGKEEVELTIKIPAKALQSY